MMPFCASKGQPSDEVVDLLAHGLPLIELLAFWGPLTPLILIYVELVMSLGGAAQTRFL